MISFLVILTNPYVRNILRWRIRIESIMHELIYVICLFSLFFFSFSISTYLLDVTFPSLRRSGVYSLYLSTEFNHSNSLLSFGCLSTYLRDVFSLSKGKEYEAMYLQVQSSVDDLSRRWPLVVLILTISNFMRHSIESLKIFDQTTYDDDIYQKSYIKPHQIEEIKSQMK